MGAFVMALRLPLLSERIVMTPKKKTRNSTTLMMERKVVLPDGKDGKVHIAGGSNAGIVVNKDGAAASTGINGGGGGGGDNPAHLFLEFRVFLVNASTKRFTQEKRRISFWFKEAFAEGQRAYAAQEFFKKLVSPIEFPRGTYTSNSASTTAYVCLHIVFNFSTLLHIPHRLRWIHQEDNEADAKGLSDAGDRGGRTYAGEGDE